MLDRLTQVGLELQAGGNLGPHRRLEEGIRTTAADLGSVHRDIGVAQHVVRRAVPALGHNHADAAADRDLALIDSELRTESRRDALRQFERALRRANVVDKDGKLIAPEPRDRVFGPHRRDQALADGNEKPITNRVPETVVDRVEPV